MLQLFCKIGDQELGPFSPDQLKEMASAGDLAPEDLVRRENDEEWILARRLKTLTFGNAKLQNQRQSSAAARKHKHLNERKLSNDSEPSHVSKVKTTEVEAVEARNSAKRHKRQMEAPHKMLFSSDWITRRRAVIGAGVVVVSGLLIILMFAGVGSSPTDSEATRVLQTEVAQDGRGTEGLLYIVIDGKYGYIDRDGKIVIEPRFDFVSSFHDGYACACVKLRNKWGLIDRTGKTIIEPRFDSLSPVGEGMFAFAIHRKKPLNIRGYLSPSGQIVFQQTGIGTLFGFREGKAQFRVLKELRKDGSSRGKYGFVDKKGLVIIPPKFDHADLFFSEGLVAVKVDRKWGYIDETGRQVIRPQFEEVENFSNGLAAVQSQGVWGYIDPNGTQVILPTFERANDFSDGLAAVYSGLWGYIDKTGQYAIPPKYKFALSFHEGLAAVSVGGLWGFIDKSGIIVIQPQFDWSRSFDQGLCEVGVKDRKGNTTSAVIDKKGTIVFKLPPDKSIDWRETDGIFVVRTQGKEGFEYIDRSGKYIWRHDVAQEPDRIDNKSKKNSQSQNESPRLPISWKAIRESIGRDPQVKVEEGNRDGQRYLLLSGKLLIVEGKGAVDVFFPAHEEGRLTWAAFSSSGLFTSSERDQLSQLLHAPLDTERVVGRFRVALRQSSRSRLDLLPDKWVRLNFEAAAGRKNVQHTKWDWGQGTLTDLLQDSRLNEVNQYLNTLLSNQLPRKEVTTTIRMVNVLADSAGLSSDNVLRLLKQAVEDGRKKGLNPVLAVDAVQGSLAYAHALQKIAYEAWLKSAREHN